MIVVCGQTGRGKSYTSLKIAKELDPTFNEKTLRDRVVWSPEQFIDLCVNRGDELNTGNAIIFDESGTGLASRNWASKMNKSVSFIAQTFRFRKLLVIFTLPSMSMLDSQIRQLFHFYVQALKVDFNTNHTICKVYEMSYNPMIPDKVYRKRIRAKGEEKEPVALDKIGFKKINAKLANAYEKYALEFKKDIGQKALVMSKDEKKAKMRTAFDPTEIANKIMHSPERYTKDYHGKKMIDKGLIEIDFKVGGAKAKRIAKMVESSIFRS